MQPVIIPRSAHPISRKWVSPNALRVLYRLKEQGYLAYLVGGSVRDLSLGREPKDFDIATDARPNEIKKIFRNCRLIGRRFRLAHIHFHDEIIEVATFRSNVTAEPEAAEVPHLAGQKAQAEGPEAVITEAENSSPPPGPASAVTEKEAPPAPERPRPPRLMKTEDGMILRDNVFGTPEQDALRRDFTVNALFYNIADFSVIDYVGGVNDLRKGLIRIIGDPLVRFVEDPVRMVRAVRFAAMLGFEIEKKTLEAILELKDRLAMASNARMYEETQKLFLLGEGEKTFQMLRRTGLFGVMFPRVNEWLDTEEGGFPRVRAGKALEWVDTCVQAGRKVEPHMLYAFMFGQYIEEKRKRFTAEGTAPLEALDKAVAEFMGEHVSRVQTPRKAGLAVRDILWNQHRFEKTRGKQPLYFLRRPGFEDAFEYLRFTSELDGEQGELKAWWKEFIKEHRAAAGQVAPHRKEHRRPEKRDRKRRRPRRRNPKSQTPNPT
jgi:poly(A) polymerase